MTWVGVVCLKDWFFRKWGVLGDFREGIPEVRCFRGLPGSDVAKSRRFLRKCTGRPVFYSIVRYIIPDNS
jgi:hypothetical protein